MRKKRNICIFTFVVCFVFSLFAALSGQQPAALAATAQEPVYYPNVKISDFAAIYASGGTFSQVDNGVKITSPARVSRISYTKFNPIDGMHIFLKDINLLTPQVENDVAVLAFNIGPQAGHYFSGVSEGVFFNIVSRYVDGEILTTLLVKKASLAYLTNSGTDVYISNEEITVFEDNIIPSSINIDFKKQNQVYVMSLNGQAFNIPANALEDNIKENKTALVVFGGFNAIQEPGKTPVDKSEPASFTVHTVGTPQDEAEKMPEIDGKPISPTISASNTVLGNYEDAFATGSVLSSHKNGIKLVTDANPKRTTFTYPTPVDDLIIKISDINLSKASGTSSAGLAFTLTRSAGHFYGATTVGVYFRIYEEKIGNSTKVVAIIKQAAVADSATEDVYLEPTVLTGFGDKMPNALEIKFKKDTGKDIYKVSINGISIDIPIKNIDDHIFANKRALVTFGGYSQGEATISYVINHIGSVADTKVNGNGNATNKTIKVLAIGNSFSVDGGMYLSDIARAAGIEVILGIAVIGGSSLEDHWTSISTDDPIYHYRLTNAPFSRNKKLEDILKDDDWEYIIVQQASNLSGLWDTYEPYLSNIANYIKENKPNAEILVHQTWAYDLLSAHPGYANYENSQQKMYDGIVESYNNAAAKLGARLIPCGDAMQIARSKGPFDQSQLNFKSLCADGYHASLQHGRYLLASVWYELLTGNSILDNPMTLVGITNDELAILQQAAHQAVSALKNDGQSPGIVPDNGSDNDSDNKTGGKCNSAVISTNFFIIAILTTFTILVTNKKIFTSKKKDRKSF